MSITLGFLSSLGDSFITTSKLMSGASHNSQQLNHIEIPMTHEIRPFRKTGIPFHAATIFTESDDNEKMTIMEEERILQVDEVTQALIGMMRIINEPTSNSYFAKGEIDIIILSHALHLLGIGIGFLIGKLIIERQNKI